MLVSSILSDDLCLDKKIKQNLSSSTIFLIMMVER